MADIDIQCPECKSITSVSEFASEASVKCGSCGHKLEQPDNVNQYDRKPKIGLKRKRDTSTGEAGESAPGFLQTMKPPERRKAKSEWRASQHIVAWLLFILIGCAAGFARYGNYVDKDILGVVAQYAPLVVIAFHVLTVLKAFQDSVFQGILCLLVPFYSLFYLFVMSDDFYLRGVFAGLLVGIAQDSYFFFQAQASNIYNSVTAWIASGG